LVKKFSTIKIFQTEIADLNQLHVKQGYIWLIPRAKMNFDLSFVQTANAKFNINPSSNFGYEACITYNLIITVISSLTRRREGMDKSRECDM
jgi:hypothetical protein